MYPEDFRYTKDHEWIELEGQTARVGITEYAQSELGDVAFIELPQVGQAYKQGDTFGTIESVKAVSDLYVPVAGEVIQVNQTLEDEPELVNEDAHGEGWLIVMKVSDPSELEELLSAEEYEDHISEEAEDDLDDDEDDSDGDFDDEDDYDGDDDEDY